MPPDLIIFDCDGVLVDSEPIANRVFAEVLNEVGLSLTLDEMFEHFVGRSMPQCLLRIEQMLGRAPPPDLAERYARLCTAALERELEPVAGVADLLDRLDAAAIPYCVASNGDHAKMRTTLGLTGFADRFHGRRFSATDVPLPKPAPDLFLHAAAHMGVEPARCVVVEDTPTGVAAAVAAGMTVYGYAAHTPAARLRDAGAALTFTAMDRLHAVLLG